MQAPDTLRTLVDKSHDIFVAKGKLQKKIIRKRLTLLLDKVHTSLADKIYISPVWMWVSNSSWTHAWDNQRICLDKPQHWPWLLGQKTPFNLNWEGASKFWHIIQVIIDLNLHCLNFMESEGPLELHCSVIVEFILAHANRWRASNVWST